MRCFLAEAEPSSSSSFLRFDELCFVDESVGALTMLEVSSGYGILQWKLSGQVGIRLYRPSTRNDGKW